MNDRVPAVDKANRVKITLDDSSVVEGVLSYADDATVEGSAYTKGNVLPDDVCAAIGIATTAEPKDAFSRLGENYLGFADIAKSFAETVISTNTTLASTINIYKNLTINSGVTLFGVSGLTIIIVTGTLTLDGTISVVGKGRVQTASIFSYIGDGGSGAGILLLKAKKIVGTGSILANGSAGTSPTASAAANANENAGASGTYLGYTVQGGGVSASLYGAGAAPSTANITNSLALLFLKDLNSSSNLGAGAGSGGASDTTSSYTATSGGGGAGIAGNGGAGAAAVSVSGSNGGSGGGGGAGAILIASESSIPALTLQANGGNGGAEYGTYGKAGGGGGGGLISIVAPSSSATYSVTGGTGYSNGSTGLVEIIAV